MPNKFKICQMDDFYGGVVNKNMKNQFFNRVEISHFLRALKMTNVGVHTRTKSELFQMRTESLFAVTYKFAVRN